MIVYNMIECEITEDYMGYRLIDTHSWSRYASRHSAAGASEQIRTMHQSSIKISYYLFDGIA